MTDKFKKNNYIEQPLPLEVSISSDSWLTRARNYPVFSRTWYYYRSLSWIIPVLVIDVFSVIIPHLMGIGLEKILLFVLPLSLGFLSLGLIGTGLAVLVRQRQFSEKIEAFALAAALLIGVGLSDGVLKGVEHFCDWFAGENRVHGKITVLDASIDDKKESPVRKKKEPLQVTVQQSPAAPAPPTAPDAPAAPSAPAAASLPDPNSQNSSFHPVLSKEMRELLQNFTSISITGFIVIYLGGGFDLWLFFRQKKRLLEDQRLRELKQAQEARREAELRLSVLVAQVEPHFLFNTLAGVRSAINTEPARATAIVDHLVDYLRATIPKMRSDGSSTQARLMQQLDAARAFLNLMQARIPRLSFSVESEISDAALPPLMLISLVENAIKHGVEPKIGPAHIAVLARQSERDGKAYMELSVADDGVGFGGTSSGSGIGLENIRERLASMYGTEATLTLKANRDGGVTALISLPLEK